MEMVKRINRQAAVLLIVVALFSALFDWKRMPLGVLVGGLLALANLKGIHWGVNAMIRPGTANVAKGRLIVFSFFRLMVMFVVLAILLYLHLINIFGVLIGLTIVFVLILKEGLVASKNL